ncbi:MAG: hypothetical protein JW917_08285 [Ignavibacteria bacterium]|nr:hypothetical protein [Ignavibacteria bacterium]
MKTHIFILVILPLLLFILPQNSFSQENEEFLIDSLDYKEDLLDSNEVYKAMYDSLENDGKWVSVKKSEFIKSVGGEEADDIDENYYNENEILYLWQPNITLVQVNWSPYTNGYWLYTTAGWIWISYYNWGWAPYNYGRWWWSSYYGWVWMPGRIWAPNWCIWRHHHHYIGWYPIHPRIRWRGRYHKWHRNRVVISRPKHWTFVEKEKFTEPIYEDSRVRDLEIAKKSTRLADNYSKELGVRYSGPNIKSISEEKGVFIEPVTVDPKTRTIKEDVKYRNTETTPQIDDRYKDTKTNSETPNKELPKKETPKVETPKTETPKYETPKQEQPKYDPPKKETPKQEQPKYDPPKKETPKQQPKYDPPKKETPKQSPKYETPKQSTKSGSYGNSGRSGNTGKSGNTSKSGNSGRSGNTSKSGKTGRR